MAKLPTGVAAVLANMEAGRVILCSDALSPAQRAAAALVARYKAITGAPAVVVWVQELASMGVLVLAMAYVAV